MTTEDVDQAAWSMAKIGRARQHGLELQSRMIAWLSNEDLRPNATIADDRLSWEVRLTKFDGPPLNEWALILGDAIHNLRSALDVLVWTYADAASLTAKQAKNIAFPVWSEQSKWDENVSRILQTVPPVIVERIKEVQPFQRPPLERPADPLSLIAQLDNTDKHRLALTTTVQPQGAEVEHSIEFTDEAAAARNVPPDVTIHEPALVPSALLLSGTTVDPIAKIKGNFGFTQKVGIETPNGLVGVTELIEGLALYAAQVVTHVKG